jgi:hypothetical protein
MTEVIDDLFNKSNAAKCAEYKNVLNKSTKTTETIQVVSRYIPDSALEELAVSVYHSNGRGITFADVRSKWPNLNKIHAQWLLTNHVKKRKKKQVLFTRGLHKPQQYFPKCLEAEILLKSTRIDHTYPSTTNHACGSLRLPPTDLKVTSLDAALNASRKIPLGIHRIKLRTRIDPDYLITDGYNIPKHHREPLENTAYLDYRIERNGTIMVDVACSSHPFPLRHDHDVSYLFSCLGQVRHNLLFIVKDPHGRIVPNIMDWFLVSCDLTRMFLLVLLTLTCLDTIP